MLSLKLEYDIPQDRYLRIQLPPMVSPGKHEIVLVVDNTLENMVISPSEQFADLIGSLSWPEDPLEYQQRLRKNNRDRSYN